MSALALLAVAAVACVPVAVLVGTSIAQAAGSPSTVAWRKHHEEIRSLPDELYHRDRFRAIRGRITDEDGKPVSGALVRCVKLESLLELAKAGKPASSKWIVPIEAETTANDDGAYGFPHLPVGARTFFYSASGRNLAPAIKDLVVVQDGLGAQLNVTLGRPAVLHVRVAAPAKVATRLHLIPHRWWPTLLTVLVPPGETSVEFPDLGGPLRKGLIAASGPEDSSPLRVVGRYDLERSDQIALPPPPSAGNRIAA